MTVGIGIIWLFFLPDRPTHCSPILFPKWKMLNEREIHILATRVIIDDAQKSAGSRVHIDVRDTLHVLGNWRLWQHVMISFIGMMPAQALGLYFPSIIQALGFAKLKANALSVTYFRNTSSSNSSRLVHLLVLSLSWSSHGLATKQLPSRTHSHYPRRSSSNLRKRTVRTSTRCR